MLRGVPTIKKVLIVMLALVAVGSGLIFFVPSIKERTIPLFAPLMQRVRGKQPPRLDTADYDQRMLRLAGIEVSTSTPAGVVSSTFSVAASSAPAPWPAKTPYPKPGAILPFNRVVAYYGNFRSKHMGILGEYPEDEVLNRLKREVERWKAADPLTPVIPAIHYVSVVAQGDAGKDGKYRLRMPESDLKRVLALAEKVGGVAFYDIQIAKSTVQAEVPLFDPLLKHPNVHLGLDPEFAMKGTGKPGHRIGTMDAAEINWAIQHMSKIVEENNLPPKILVIHRFVPPMVTNSHLIKPTPQVQVVIDMDGWGLPSRKRHTFRLCVYKEPVQFAGFKIFYKNDLKEEGSRLMTPDEVLSLIPKPIYIQYQ
jgi:hypothetical protein